jgi:hypothetical protein
MPERCCSTSPSCPQRARSQAAAGRGAVRTAPLHTPAPASTCLLGRRRGKRSASVASYCSGRPSRSSPASSPFVVSGWAISSQSRPRHDCAWFPAPLYALVPPRSPTVSRESTDSCSWCSGRRYSCSPLCSWSSRASEHSSARARICAISSARACWSPHLYPRCSPASSGTTPRPAAGLSPQRTLRDVTAGP